MQLTERANKGLHDYLFSFIEAQTWFSQIKSVLDIGCGSGAWLSRFSRTGAITLTGVDLDTTQFGLPGARSIQLNLDDDNPALGSFDFISSLELIEHLENPGKLFQFVTKNLSVKGYWLLSTPNLHSVPARLKFLLSGRLPHFDHKSDPTHIYPVYFDNLKKLCLNHGFEIVYRGSYPAKGYNNFKGPIRLTGQLLSLVLPASVKGDNLVLILRKKHPDQ